jgi:hypothetical protein
MVAMALMAAMPDAKANAALPDSGGEIAFHRRARRTVRGTAFLVLAELVLTTADVW